MLRNATNTCAVGVGRLKISLRADVEFSQTDLPAGKFVSRSFERSTTKRKVSG